MRIVRRRRIPAPALISLIATAAVSGLLLVLWLFWRGEQVEVAVVRGLSDVELTWRCEGSHVFKARAENGQQKCIICGKEAYAIAEFECPTHGRVEVEAKFEADVTGVMRASKFRVAGGKWVDVGEPLLCSKCGAVLKRKPEDPLDKAIVGKKRSGG